ncbi:hypothetical protein C8R44DRAFT_747705 [Mycena epipterygia]|nr:hypothetical protein C8R44DRAFT_747705 [Mycena epipterygia]
MSSEGCNFQPKHTCGVQNNNVTLLQPYVCHKDVRKNTRGPRKERGIYAEKRPKSVQKGRRKARMRGEKTARNFQISPWSESTEKIACRPQTRAPRFLEDPPETKAVEGKKKALHSLAVQQHLDSNKDLGGAHLIELQGDPVEARVGYEKPYEIPRPEKHPRNTPQRETHAEPRLGNGLRVELGQREREQKRIGHQQEPQQHLDSNETSGYFYSMINCERKPRVRNTPYCFLGIISHLGPPGAPGTDTADPDSSPDSNVEISGHGRHVMPARSSELSPDAIPYKQFRRSVYYKIQFKLLKREPGMTVTWIALWPVFNGQTDIAPSKQYMEELQLQAVSPVAVRAMLRAMCQKIHERLETWTYHITQSLAQFTSQYSTFSNVLRHRGTVSPVAYSKAVTKSVYSCQVSVSVARVTLTRSVTATLRLCISHLAVMSTSVRPHILRGLIEYLDAAKWTLCVYQLDCRWNNIEGGKCTKCVGNMSTGNPKAGTTIYFCVFGIVKEQPGTTITSIRPDWAADGSLGREFQIEYDRQLLTLAWALELHGKPAQLGNEIVLRSDTDTVTPVGAALFATASLTILSDDGQPAPYYCMEVQSFEAVFLDTN